MLAIGTAGLVGGAAFAAEPTPPTPPGPVVKATYSSSDRSLKLAEGDDLTFEPIDGTAVTTIGINPSETGQTLDGLGGSLESSSVFNIAHLSPSNRDGVMNALFNTETGNGYDLMRLSFGCPDFCSEDFYTYDDMPTGETDPTLANFSIQKDIDMQIVSVAKQALAINPDVEFFASAWSPPAWMKDNQSLNNGGSVLPSNYPVLAQYYRMAIAAYAEQGIPIKALTVNNEPLVVPDYPSASWTWEQERDFIPYLRAELDAYGLDTEIWIQDDNWWTTSQFANILADPIVGPMVDGVAVHDYDDGDVTQAAALVKQYPDITVRLTERSYYDVKGVDRMIQLLRNDVSSWTYWLTFLDEDGLPNAGPLDGDSFPQQIGAPHGNLDAWYLDRDYYLYAQFTRFLERGAVRVSSDYGSVSSVTNVTFRNPDGTLVSIVDNQTDYSQPFRLVSVDGQVTDTLPAGTVGTYTWTPDRTPLDRAAWTTTASTQEWGANQMLDNDEATAWRNFSAQTPTQSVTIDTGLVQPLSQLTLDQGTLENGSSANDWPRGYSVFASIDGSNWGDPIATGRGTARFTNVAFATVDARYVRVELTAPAPSNYWSVAEVFAFAGDNTKPVVTLTADPQTPNGAAGWYVSAVTVTAQAADDSATPLTLETSIDGGPWSAAKPSIIVASDGSHSISARATDGSGNVSDEAVWTAGLDTVGPVATATADNTAGTIVLSATDATSGVERLEYTKDSAAAADWQVYSAPVSTVVGESISYRAIDVAGNTSVIAQATRENVVVDPSPNPTDTATSTGNRPVTPASDATGRSSRDHLAQTGFEPAPLMALTLVLLSMGLGIVAIRRSRLIGS